MDEIRNYDKWKLSSLAEPKRADYDDVVDTENDALDIILEKIDNETLLNILTDFLGGKKVKEILINYYNGDIEKAYYKVCGNRTVYIKEYWE